MGGTVGHHILYLQYLQVFCLVLYGHYHLGHDIFATTMPYVDHKLNAGCKCLEPWQKAIQQQCLVPWQEVIKWDDDQPDSSCYMT